MLIFFKSSFACSLLVLICKALFVFSELVLFVAKTYLIIYWTWFRLRIWSRFQRSALKIPGTGILSFLFSRTFSISKVAWFDKKRIHWNLLPVDHFVCEGIHLPHFHIHAQSFAQCNIQIATLWRNVFIHFSNNSIFCTTLSAILIHNCDKNKKQNCAHERKQFKVKFKADWQPWWFLATSAWVRQRRRHFFQKKNRNPTILKTPRE